MRLAALAPPRRELRARLQRRVDGRLGRQPVLDRAQLAPAQQHRQGDGGDRAARRRLRGAARAADRRRRAGRRRAPGSTSVPSPSTSPTTTTGTEPGDQPAGGAPTAASTTTTGAPSTPAAGSPSTTENSSTSSPGWTVWTMPSTYGDRRRCPPAVLRGFRGHIGLDLVKIGGGHPYRRARMTLHDRLFAAPPDAGDDARWAASGAMALTGPDDGPPRLAPRSLVPFARRGGRCARARPASRSTPSPCSASGRRSPGCRATGRRSCGGSTALHRCADEWIAVSLARPDDVELLPAWLGTDDVGARRGRAVRRRGRRGRRRARHPVRPPRRGRHVGAGVHHPPAGARAAAPARSTARWSSTSRRCGPGRCAATSSRSPGPGRSRSRAPAGPTAPVWARRRSSTCCTPARSPSPSTSATARDVERLRALLAAADIVIEASRPRALAQLGIDAVASATEQLDGVGLDHRLRPRRSRRPQRVAFGDDAAVAGGLVAGDRADPVFCADAVADPLAGLTAAAAALDCHGAGGGWLVDVAMARVAAWCARLPPSAEPWTGPVARPRAGRRRCRPGTRPRHRARARRARPGERQMTRCDGSRQVEGGLTPVTPDATLA